MITKVRQLNILKENDKDHEAIYNIKFLGIVICKKKKYIIIIR